MKKACKTLGYNNKCVFASEIDRDAKEVYSANFNISKKQIIDIKLLDEKVSKIKNHDFLFAGFPCQTFSNAGNKKGFLDEVRGTLFFDIVKILKNKKPKFFLLENVKHLVKHDNGKTWKIINKSLIELGYIIPHKPLIISPHEIGIPQERQRVFIPGIIKSLIKDKKIINQINNIKEKILINKSVHKINNYLEPKVSENYFINAKLEKILEAWGEFVLNVKRLPKKTLPVIWLFELNKNYSQKDYEKMEPWRSKYIKEMKKTYEFNKKFIDNWMLKHDVAKWKKRDQKLEWHAGACEYDITKTFIQLRQSGIRCKKSEKFPTLVAMVQIPLIYDKSKRWRYLTPRETANLQSFPKKFKLFNQISNKANADYCTYKQLGNSINIEIVSIILKELILMYENTKTLWDSRKWNKTYK